MAGLKLRHSAIFPYRWLTEPEDRKFLAKNLSRAIRNSGLKEVLATSSNDAYYADTAEQLVTTYVGRIKYHAFQPVPIPLTAKQLQLALKEAFPYGKCLGMDTFFVQGSDPQVLPVMELEIYY